jgi:hypothetical protein
MLEKDPPTQNYGINIIVQLRQERNIISVKNLNGIRYNSKSSCKRNKSLLDCTFVFMFRWIPTLRGQGQK